MEEITKYVEYLFALALKKSGDVNEAEDLAQETLLAALGYIRHGGEISNVKYWLISTLSHKWNDHLRAKYRLPTVLMDVIPEVEEEEYDRNEDPADEDVRREVAYLASLHRTVIVKHYLEGKRIDAIAHELGLPRGTVLSRLSAGREQMRKGFETMKDYEKQSYAPECLELTCYGCPGFRDEPYSYVADDILKQNILILAYKGPQTVIDIARALGVPTAYVEPAVGYLLEKKLLVSIGKRVATDFMITSLEDRLEALPHQLSFADREYDTVWPIMKALFAELSRFVWYNGMSEIAQIDLKYSAMLSVFSGGLYQAMKRHVSTAEEYPDRGDGGAWIAAGIRSPMGYNFDNDPVREYSYGGERRARWERFLNSRSIDLRVYDTQPDLNKYMHAPVEIHDDMLCKLIYMIYKEVDFDRTAFNLRYLEDIPHLIECGIFRSDGDKIRVEIPILDKTQHKELRDVINSYIFKFADTIEAPLVSALPALRQVLPAHLKNKVAEYRQYHIHMIPMAVIKRAITQGDFYLPEKGKSIPMILIVEE